ncbi:hypothetical protein Tco_0850717 [Tanacetum coccineum]
MGGSHTTCYHYWEEHSEIHFEQHRMQIRDPSLVYGSEAVLPPEIGVPTYHIQSYEENKNIVDLQLNLELLKERRELAYLCEAKYKRQIERYYNSKVRHAHLRVGDFVLRKNEASQQEGHKKLDPNWE